MFSAPAVAHMVNAKEGNKKSPSSAPIINMGPASSAVDAYDNMYKSTLPVEEHSAPKKVLYNCDYCDYKTPYQHNKIRHEKLVHAVVHHPKRFRPKKPVILQPQDSAIVTVQKRPLPQEPTMPKANKKPRQSDEEEERQPVEKKEKQVQTVPMVIESGSDSEKGAGDDTETQERPVKKVKPVANIVPTVVEKEATPPAGELKCVKVEDGGKLVFYAHDIVIHICAGM
jgi:hypothetical protein